MGILTRDEILSIDDVKTETVDVPEWGGEVIVRNVGGRDRDRWEASLTQQRGNQTVQNLDNMRAKLVVKAVVDEDGNRVFSDQDANALGGKSSAAIVRVFNVAARLSGIGDDAIEDALGNSDAVPSDGSISS